MTDEHAVVEELLGAYALDAVEPDEARRIEEHLLVCPRCRAEVRAHREVAALLAHSGAPAPEGLWERIGREIAGTPGAPSPPATAHLEKPRVLRRATAVRVILAAVAASIVTVLSLETAHLDGQVHAFESATRAEGLAPLVISVLAGPHDTVTLDSTRSSFDARVAISASGEAYWVTSNLGPLLDRGTYQLWGRTARGLVSLALLGSTANGYAAFRVQPGVSQLLVTAEPEGGVPAPTGSVLLAGAVSGID